MTPFASHQAHPSASPLARMRAWVRRYREAFGKARQARQGRKHGKDSSGTNRDSLALALKWGLTLVVLLLPAVSMAAGLNIPRIVIEPQEQGQGISPVDVVLILTLLTFLPAILMTMTCFTRIVIVLFLLRQAMGIQHAPPNQVLIGLALFITVFVMKPVWTEMEERALDPYMNDEIGFNEALDEASVPLKAFMLKLTDENDLGLFLKISSGKPPKNRDELAMYQLVPAFVTSELKKAFQIGFLIYLPFLILDMLIASVLMSMGMMMLPPVIISLPFKLILFVLIDGWNLLIGSLLGGFGYS